MNEVIKAIIERKSVRFYKADKVDRNCIKEIINAGNHAPTGSGGQWRFVVVDNDEFRNKLAKLSLPYYEAWMQDAPEGFKNLRNQIDKIAKDPIYYSAPVIVFVIGKGMTADFDCPMVCQNMMIAAQSLGMGSCWVYFGQLVLKNEEIRNELELKEGEKVYGPIIFGFPQDNLPVRPPKKEPVLKWI
jgi:nitroreductase